MLDCLSAFDRMEATIGTPNSPNAGKTSDTDVKDTLDPSDFVTEISGIKRKQDGEESPSLSKKLRSEELPDEIPAVPQDLSVTIGATTDDEDQVTTFEQQQRQETETTDISGKERNASQDYSTSTAGGIPGFDPTNVSGFKMPMIPAMGTLPGGIPPGIAHQQPFLANPGFVFQGQVLPWQAQPNPFPQAAVPPPVGQHQFQDPRQQHQTMASSTNQLFTARMGGESGQNPGGGNGQMQPAQQALKLDQSGAGPNSLQSPNNSQPGGEGIGDSTSTIDTPIQLHQPQHQDNQPVQQAAVPQNAQQHNMMPMPMPMPANQMQYPPIFPNPIPPQPGPGMSETDAASFAARNRILYQQFQPMAGGMNPFLRMQLPPFMGQPPQPPAAARPSGIPLALSCDDDQLSEYQILVRKQLTIFEATQEDGESNTQGRKKQVVLGQVGIRCRHCAGSPLRQRGRGAVYYPAKLQGVYQAAQNMASSHLCESCQSIPPPLKQQLRTLRERRATASGGKQYWADGARAMGLHETPDGLKLRRRGEPSS